MNKTKDKHEICECGKCHCLPCAVKESEEPESASFGRFLRELVNKKLTVN